MTLFIACLIIYQYDMNSWLYFAAAALYAGHLTRLFLMGDNLHKMSGDLARLQGVPQKLDHTYDRVCKLSN